MSITANTAIGFLDEAIKHILKADGLLTAYCNRYDYGPGSAVQSTKLCEVVLWAHAESERLKDQFPPDDREDGEQDHATDG